MIDFARCHAHNCYMVKITDVSKGSPASKGGIKRGEYLVAFDGYPYQDSLDFLFYDSAACFTITVESASGEQRVVAISKRADTPLGIVIEDGELEVIPCRNKCIFCFVDQCPKGMRKSLYVKDDDYRLSFISGSYVTLSNTAESDIERIIRLKLSPLYISVHCYDKATKQKICANPRSADLFDIIKRLASAGIAMHTQIVMMEGINDGDILEETMRALYAISPGVESVAVVPVGLTKFRQDLYTLKPVSRECAVRTVRQVEAFNKVCCKERGLGFVWCSDELYLLAGLDIPDYSYYESFAQIENGVGLIAEFLFELRDELQYNNSLKGSYTLVTGKSFAPILTGVAAELSEAYGVELDVVAVANTFFGESVTVAGLITGVDISNALRGRLRHKNVIIPRTMLKEFETVFLDGTSVGELEKELECRIHISHGGDSLVKILCGEENG